LAVRQLKIDGPLDHNDLLAPSRDGRVHRPVTVGRCEPDPARRKGRHYRGGGLEVKVEVRASQGALGGRRLAAERQPVARRMAAVLARLEYREILRSFGLLPAFVRVEYSAALDGFVASDAFWPVYVPVQSHIRLGAKVLVNMPNPYNPLFILDAELAAEYVRSRSFDHEASRALCSWGVRERAAMGLCLENVPPPFQTRYVVPVSRYSGMAAGFCRISRLPNNYADDPRSPLGKVRVDELFVGVQDLSNQ
jgi:hypothetical protein